MSLEKILAEHGQGHLIPLLGKEGGAKLREELSAVDWETVEAWKHPDDLSGKGRISPIEGLRLSEIGKNRTKYEARGLELLRGGKVAAVLLAGGQGTRLGSDAPKGMYDIGVTRPVYLFERLIENLREVTERAGVFVPLLIMTSGENDGATRAFLREHGYFGYPERYIRFFRQEMAPCVDLEGRLLLGEDGALALSPNGNGGWYSSMKRAGADGDFPAVEWYNVFGVDNVLQRIADPVFLGATALSGCACGAKVVCKSRPEEKVGVLCREDGKPSVIEYYEISPEQAAERDEKGELKYLYGVILNYLFRADMLERIAGEHIPVHVVKKKIPHLGKEGLPAEENGYKFETLILDMVRLAGSCLPFEVIREREFAPVKNKTGADSVETARALLEKNGVKI